MCLLMARNLFVYNHYLVENMVKKIILLLVVILPLCGCNQKVQCTETSENDSIAEFFRKFYVGCNDYYAQRVNVDDSKGKAYCQALQDDFVSFLKNFCCDDIVADVNRMNFDIYGCDIDTLNDSVFGSLYVEKMKFDKNVYIVHLQTDSLHIQRPYTLTKQGGKMKISAIGKRKLPMVFCNDTLWIKDCPQCIDEFNKWHGVAISTNYDVVDSLKLAKDFRVAILSPNFDSWKDAPIPPICSDRLLLVEYKKKQEVYDNVIGNGEPTGGWLPYEMLVKPWEDKTTDFVERSDFILSYGDGNGYKIYYTIGIKMIEGKAYVTGIKWEEHDSGLSFRKQIVQEYDGKQMPLSSYSRCMPWELSQE